MEKNQALCKFVLFGGFSILLSIFLLPAYSEQIDYGKLEVTVRMANGDRAGPYGTILKIYSENNDTPLQVLTPNYTYPYFVTDLQLNNNYKIETYVNDQLSDVDYFRLEENYQKMDTFAYYPAGLGIRVLYNDSQTPISNTKVELISHKGTVISEDFSDDHGKILRAWVSPTMGIDEYYLVRVSLSDELIYNSSKINLTPGLITDIDITTPWPEIIDSLITITLKNNDQTEILNDFKPYIVTVYNSKHEKIVESKIDPRGRVFFSNVPIGNYSIQLENKSSSEVLTTKIVMINEKQTDFELFLDRQKLFGNNSTVLSANNALNNQKFFLTANYCCSDINQSNSLEIPKQIIVSWVENKIEDVEFAKEIKFLLQESNEQNLIMQSDTVKIPNWLRNTVVWWVEGKITDGEFITGIKYLVERDVLIL